MPTAYRQDFRALPGIGILGNAYRRISAAWARPVKSRRERAAAGVATSAGPGTIAGSDGGRTAVAAVFARKSGAAAARGEADAHGQTGRAGHQHPHQFRLAGDPRLGEDLLEVLAHRFVGDAQVLADFFQS